MSTLRITLHLIQKKSILQFILVPKKLVRYCGYPFAVPTKIIIYIYLQEFGHHVRLATHANFRSFVESAGVDFYPLGGDPRVLAGCKRSFPSTFFFPIFG